MTIVTTGDMLEVTLVDVLLLGNGDAGVTVEDALIAQLFGQALGGYLEKLGGGTVVDSVLSIEELLKGIDLGGGFLDGFVRFSQVSGKRVVVPHDGLFILL